MERLTHEADFGLEDWEETLFFVKSDPNGAYNIIDIAKYQGEPEFDEILKNVALRLAAYENTGLEPEEIVKIREDIENGYMKSTARRYGVPVDRLRELAAADREGRCVVLPCKIGDIIYQADYIEGALTIDAVPVVRCRECQWYNAGANDSESWSDCTLRYGKHFNVGPDDFCSYGQRKIETVLPKSDAKDESLEADQ